MPNHSSPPTSSTASAASSQPPSPLVTEPVYHQLTRLCRAALQQGDYAPGEQFPSERELANQHNISRATANKVISNLVAEGLLQFRKGIGTFVREPSQSLHSSLRQMESFTEHARALGLDPETRILAFEKQAAGKIPHAIRESLGMPVDDPHGVYYFERLRLADQEPVILEQRWLAAEFVPGLKKSDLAGSLYGLLEDRFDLTLTGERHTIRARALLEREAELFQLPPAMPALVVEGPGFGPGNRPVWHQNLLYRSDKYELVNEVQTSKYGSLTQVKICAAA